MSAPSPADLVHEHLGLARQLASRYRRRGEPGEDLEQVAMVALVAASRRFDPSRGVSFAGYATPCILGEIKRHFRDRSWGIRVPRTLSELYLMARSARDDAFAETGHAPTMPELADRIGCSVEVLIEAMEAGQNFRPASVEGLGETRPHQLPSTDGGYDRLIEHHRLAQLLPELTELDRRVLALRFGEERTQASIAAELGVSQMQVSRLLDRIIRRLRMGMEVN